jgi:RHS repeat-associated protein
LVEFQSGTTNYYEADGLGSVTSLTSAAGAVAQTYAYDSFGRQTASSGSLTNPFRYAGREFDTETNLSYNRARYFDSNAGMFLTEDPIRFKGGINFYAYTRNNPANYTDPLGLCPDTSNPSQQCQDALATAGTDADALDRAMDRWGEIQAAAGLHGIDPNLLAAIGVRETGYRNTRQRGGGQGAGIFQIDLGQNPSVTTTQAFNPAFAANFAASMLAANLATLAAEYPNFTPAQLLQATAASYNFGTGNISGNPNTIDVGSSGGNYGSNVVNLMSCFQ